TGSVHVMMAAGPAFVPLQAGGPVLGLARGTTFQAVSIPGATKADTAGSSLLRTTLPESRPLGANAVAFLPGNMYVVGAAEKGLNVWRMVPGRATTVEKSVPVSSPVTAVAASEAGDVACGSMDGVVRLYAAKTYEKRHELKGHDGEVRAVLLTRDGKRAFSAG